MTKKMLKGLEEAGIIDAIGDPISIQDTNFVILYQNRVHKNLVGDRRGEYCYKAYQGKNDVCEGCHLAMSFKDGMIHTVEQSRVTEKGIVYSENTASPLRDPTGEIVAAIEVVRDITARKLLEDQLKAAIKMAEEEKAKSEAIIASIGDSLIIVDTNLKIMYENKIMKDMFGDRTGEYCYKAHEGRDQPCEDCALPLCLRDGKIYKTSKKKTGAHGIRYIETTSSPLIDSRGAIIGGIEFGRDISDRVRMEEALQKANDELEKRVKERTLELEESNTALKVLLKQREQDQRELEENILSNIKHLILPYIEKLKKNRSMSEDLVYLNTLESNLKEIVSPFSSRLSFQYLDFTPKEILVANLIKDGKQDKDIMEILNISLETVKSHRQNIRKKLTIYGKRTNLRTKLLSLME